MRKQAAQIVFLLAAVGALAIPAWAAGTAQSGVVTKKYPPYPDVWGYELPWPGKDDRVIHPIFFKMPDGEYYVTYVRTREKFKMKDGTCCEFRHEYARLAFFTGEKQNISDEELNKFGKEHHKSQVRVESVVFPNGTKIERKSKEMNCYVSFPYSIVKKDSAGRVMTRKMLLYIPDSPQWRDIKLCEGAGRSTFLEKVAVSSVRFVPLEDDTFIVYEPGGNVAIRFDRDLHTHFRLGQRVFLIDADTIERIIADQPDAQAENDAVYSYMQQLKKEGGR